MKKILVATDFSEYADYAIKSATAIANQTGAKLFLLHVIKSSVNSVNDSKKSDHNPTGNNKAANKIQTKLEAITNQYRIKGARIIYESSAEIFKTIIKHADRHNVDLIVMGAYGGDGIGKSFVGSNTERVMVQAKMPLLIVKEKYSEFNIENIIIASEFYGELSKVFPKMKNIIDLFRANIHLLKVNTPNQFQVTKESMKLMNEFSNEFNLDKCSKNIYNDRTIEEGIMNFANQVDADLIAITPDGFKRLTHVFNKNITNELMKKPIKVILSMKIQKPVSNPAEFYFTDPENTIKEMAKM